MKLSEDLKFFHQVWQDSFKAKPLWSGWMIDQKINYIHANPVKGKVSEVGEGLLLVQFPFVLLSGDGKKNQSWA